VKKIQNIINKFKLFQNYPNPFNPNTTIQYQLTKSGDVEVNIFNINGQIVRKLLSGFQTSGVHGIVWDGKDDNGQKVSSGFYLYEVKFENAVQTKKMILLK
jgi:flagellar hook assembly protein FlgD